jgi:hypothetical protein
MAFATRKRRKNPPRAKTGNTINQCAGSVDSGLIPFSHRWGPTCARVIILPSPVGYRLMVTAVTPMMMAVYMPLPGFKLILWN